MRGARAQPRPTSEGAGVTDPGAGTAGEVRKGGLAIDPRGVIFEAYRMEIGPEDCRSIFLDWALGLAGPVRAEDVAALLAHYGPRHPDHPMTAVLRAGLEPSPRRRRRRGF